MDNTLGVYTLGERLTQGAAVLAGVFRSQSNKVWLLKVWHDPPSGQAHPWLRPLTDPYHKGFCSSILVPPMRSCTRRAVAGIWLRRA